MDFVTDPQSHAASATSQLPNDVQLVFPFAGGRELWARSTLLSAASPYFKALFHAGFSESLSNKHTPIALESGERSRIRTFEDSDDEVDDDPGLPSSRTPATNQPSPIPFHRIVVKEVAYTTYVALLVWIQSKHIEFAPLTSTFLSHPENRLAKIISAAKNDPLLPSPPSPKFVYRLAHILEIPELEQLALSSIGRQLTAENVALELVGDVSRHYPEVQEMCMDFAVKNWKAVKESEAMREIERRMEADELPGGNGVAIVLLKLAKSFEKA